MKTSRHYRLPGQIDAKRRRALAIRRFRRARLLIVGCGDVGLRLASLIHRRVGDRIGVIGTTRRADQAATLRAAGVLPLAIDLDRTVQARRLRGLAGWLIDLAPPPATGLDDPRTRRLIAATARADTPLGSRWVYVSTTGVYGHCDGARFEETRTARPASDRARRRVAAERRLRDCQRRRRLRLSILRTPGIYAGDRLPIQRLERRMPALLPEEDVHTNHIHALDLARLSLAALFRGAGGRVFHACDDTELKMGDYFDRVADALSLPRPPRMRRAEAAQVVTPAMMSFMSESRRLDNTRIKRELRFRLRYPTVEVALRELAGGKSPGGASGG